MTPVLTTDTTSIKTGTLEKTGESYALVSLSADDIDQILALEDLAFDALPDDEKAFLLKKDRAFFENHFAQGNTMLGILKGSCLIAQSVILNPTTAHPKTGMVDMPELTGTAPGAITVQQGVIVDPAYRGNHLMDVMVKEWLAESEKAGRTEAVSEVAVENAFSWSVYLKNGLHIESLGVDASDGTVVYNMHGHIPALSQIFNAAAEKKTCAQTDLVQQIKSVRQGYKGESYNPKTGVLSLGKVRAPCF